MDDAEPPIDSAEPDWEAEAEGTAVERMQRLREATDGPPIESCPICGTPYVAQRKWNSGSPMVLMLPDCECPIEPPSISDEDEPIWWTEFVRLTPEERAASDQTVDAAIDGLRAEPSSICDACGQRRTLTVYPLCSLCDECIAELGITATATRLDAWLLACSEDPSIVTPHEMGYLPDGSQRFPDAR